MIMQTGRRAEASKANNVVEAVHVEWELSR